MAFHVYILRCADDSYYTGHTDDLERRIGEHRSGAIPGCYTHARRPVALVYVQDFPTRAEALASETQIKRWSRAKKEALAARDWDSLKMHAMNRAGRASIHGSTGSPRTDALDTNDEEWMRRALDLAARAHAEDNEIPVGALVVDAAGTLVGEGWNRNISESDPSAHAEIVAMRRAGAALGNHRLVGCTLYVTLEPCAMCSMAAVHARLARVVYGASDPKTGAAGSVFDLLADPRHNHRVDVVGGVLGEEAGAMLTSYFRAKRAKNA